MGRRGATRCDLCRQNEQQKLSTKPLICSGFLKPSDGLEPSTPSLPWRCSVGTREHVRASASMIDLQIRACLRVACARGFPLMHRLMYTSRTRALLSVR